MLLENPSTYVLFEESTIEETDFLRAIAKRTGCGLLLDVNNMFVSATNHGFDPEAYLAAFPLSTGRRDSSRRLFRKRRRRGGAAADRRARFAGAERGVGALRHAIALCGPTPTLIEWDNDVPAWPTLFAEAQRAEQVLCRPRRRAESDAVVV